MVVAEPQPLRDRSGTPMTNASATMHVLGAKDGCTKICHFRSSRWVPANTLYLVALKGRIWLEAYEAHVLTGQPIDRFLRHMPDDGSVDTVVTGPVSEEEGVFLRLLRRLFS